MSLSGYNIVEKNGVPARSRFTDPQALRAVYDKLTEDDVLESGRRAKIRRMYDGNLPYDPEQLKQCGLKNIANVNFLGLKGVIDNRSGAVLRLASDTTELVELRPLSRELAGPDAAKIARIVSKEFSRSVREEGKVIPALSMMNREADLYGLGPVAWASAEDYNPVALERGQVRFVPDGPVNSSEHELFMFEAQIPASYMFYLLDHQEEAAAMGWDVPAVKRWVVDAFRNGMETRATPGMEGGTSWIESALSLIRQNRFEEEHQFDRLNVIHAFVKEMGFPRGVSHYITPASEQKEFLFKAVNAYQTMDECFLWFPYSSTERYARAVRGLASFLFPVEALNNRFTCQLVDVSFRAATFVLAQKAAGAQQQLTINEVGPYTVIPADYAPAQSQVAPNIQQLAQTKSFLDSVGVNSVTGGSYGPTGTTGFMLEKGPDRQTKAEVELQQRQRSQKEIALFVQRLTVFDKVFRETFRRFIRIAVSPDPTKLVEYPEVASFVERCARQGVTQEMLAALPQLYTVVTCRDLILGSEGVVEALGNILGSFGGTLDEAGRRQAVRTIVSLRLGDRQADDVIPEISRDQAPSDQASFAELENSVMKMGGSVMMGQDQWHWAHIPVHAKVLQEIVEQVQAPEDNNPESESFGAQDQSVAEQTLQRAPDPKSVLQLLVRASQHVQEHLSVGGRQIGMEARAKEVMKMIRDLRPTTKALNLAVATQERVEQAQREKEEREMQELRDRAEGNDFAKEKYKADLSARVAQYKADLDHDIALRRLGQEGELGARRTDREDRAADADIARRDREAAAREERDDRLARAKVNAADAVARMNAVQEVSGFGRTTPEDVMSDEGSGDMFSL